MATSYHGGQLPMALWQLLLMELVVSSRAELGAR